MGDGAAVGTTIAPVYCCWAWAVPNCMLPGISFEPTDRTAWPGTTTPIPLLEWYSKPPPPPPKPLPALADECFNVAAAGDATSSSPRTRFIADHIGNATGREILFFNPLNYNSPVRIILPLCIPRHRVRPYIRAIVCTRAKSVRKILYGAAELFRGYCCRCFTRHREPGG